MKFLLKPLFIGLLLWAGSLQLAVADLGQWGPERNVVINGQLVTGEDLLLLDTLNGGLTPAGRYWLNVETGAWGYEGGPQQGVIGTDAGESSAANPSTNSRSYDEVRDEFCVKNPGVCP